MTTTGWTPVAGDFPFPPANGTAMSAFTGTAFDIRWDDPSTLNTGPATPSTRASLTITVVGIPAVRAAATATITVLSAPLPVGANVTVNGIQFTSVAGVPGVNQFNGSIASTTTVAANLAAAVQASVLHTNQLISASAASNIITLAAMTEGDAGNALTLGSADPNLMVSGGFFTGGNNGSYLQIATQFLHAATTRTSGNKDFIGSPTPATTAQSLAAAINDKANNIGFVTASAFNNVVTLYAYLDGSMGNGIDVATDTVAFTLSATMTTGGYGVPCRGQSNTRWSIVGVNVYRSDTGERGPYFRVNKVPIGGTFYRDRTDVVLVENEIVDWSWGWIYKGDAPNVALWRLRTRYRTVVKATGNAVPANSPADVQVTIDGQMVPIAQVIGENGQIDLDTNPIWNPATETYVYPPLPKADGTSEVLVTYRYARLKITTDLDNNAKVFWRVTTVAVDPTGTSPSGLVETPLGYSPPISALDSEKLDYIWTEAIRRNRWILEQGGERVKLFIRRVSGVPCPCQWDAAEFAFAKQPYNYCSCCYGTGYLGGYEGPIDMIIAPDESERRVSQTPMGRRLENTYEVWTGPRPLLSQRDFIVKQNGERFSIGPVRRTQVRGLVLQQAFQIGNLDEKDIRYCVPLVGLETLPWPQTRYTNPENAYERPESPCAEGDPFPVGYDYQATPMGSEVPKIPDGRERRGRTPVWANIMYGGKGP